ncbi:hypothetical protein VP01_3030g2, partial [Puccinia sorghi]
MLLSLYFITLHPKKLLYAPAQTRRSIDERIGTPIACGATCQHGPISSRPPSDGSRPPIKPETPAPPVQPSDRGVDLQRFWIADGPVYRGPFNAVEPFLNWVKAIEVFLDKDKIRIAGGLIQETNSLSFYTSDSSVHLNSMWKDFKASFMTFTLPALWSTKLQEQLRHLKMGETETFIAYKAVTFGLLQDLKTK